jgi:para-aminobenzoate synthetase component 1
MSTVRLDELPYCPDSSDLFASIRELPGAAMLDSAYPYSQAGRFDVLVAEPVDGASLVLSPGADAATTRQFYSDLAAVHTEYFGGIGSAHHDIPFCGGMLGYIGYDSGTALHGITANQQPAGIDPACLHGYDWCVLQDHLLQRTVLVTQPRVSASRRRELLARFKCIKYAQQTSFELLAPFESDISEEQYRQAFERIQAYLHAGDCYQVNYARRFTALYRGDPWLAYRQLRAVAAAPFSAFVALRDGNALMSLSPERFLALQGSHVHTSPIKGTRPRHGDPAADHLAAQALLQSPKDRAENLMIVDLLRNDLGRCCTPGSIHVERLFEVQSFATVHHLVSTISGELAPDTGPWALLEHCFPGGSITGAPKKRAMEIIAELEPTPREAYCGAVLYISADGRMDSNIAIRSLVAAGGSLRCWAGGGIVADSQCGAEYQETWDKVGRLLTALEALQA